MNTWNNWGPTAVIVAGYIIAVYFQNRRLDDVNRRLDDAIAHFDKRFDDLYRYLDLRFGEIERRLSVLEKEAQ